MPLARVALAGLFLFGCASSAAGPGARHGGSPGGSNTEAHISKETAPGHAVSEADILGRLDEAVRDVPMNAMAERIAIEDVGYPQSAEEARKMGGMALLLVTALSRDPKELPLARVVLHVGDKAYPLPRLLYRVGTLANPDSPAGRAFGVHRYDGLYYIPIAATRTQSGLTIDFAANRQNFRGLQFDGSGELADGVAEVPIGNPDPDSVAFFGVREFPLLQQGEWLRSP
jgi:hypothetical protein